MSAERPRVVVVDDHHLFRAGVLHQLTQAMWVVMLQSFALWATMVLTVVSGLHYAWIAAHKPSSSHALPGAASK